MKILIISYYFPPFNVVGAIRAGKMAKYLKQLGHDVRVLAADHQLWAPNLPVEIEEKYIIRTPWFNVNKPIELLLGGKKKIAAQGFQGVKKLPSIFKAMGYFYKDCINFPDGQIGWYPYAIKAGKKLLDAWKPDFIWGSSSPPTSFLIAKKLSKYYKVPWVADFRDLWADNHNAELYYSAIRRFIDAKLEKRVLATASALITVSEPLADILKNKFTQPVAVITNGYDLEDYPKPDENKEKNSEFNIVYTGMIYPKKEDFSPFFEALSLLGDDIKNIKINFYGKGSHLIQKNAIQYGVADIVRYHDPVSYQESLRLQVNADLLLLLIFDTNKERGALPVKLFEYLGARKPILLVGYQDCPAADIIRKLNRGCVDNSATAIAQFLKKCLLNKIEDKSPLLPLDSVCDYSRLEKAKELVTFLESLH